MYDRTRPIQIPLRPAAPLDTTVLQDHGQASHYQQFLGIFGPFQEWEIMYRRVSLKRQTQQWAWGIFCWRISVCAIP